MPWDDERRADQSDDNPDRRRMGMGIIGVLIAAVAAVAYYFFGG